MMGGRHIRHALVLPKIMSVSDFKSDTAKTVSGNALKKKILESDSFRGSNIRSVDKALEAYHEYKGNNADKRIALLSTLVDACLLWLKTKKNKPVVIGGTSPFQARKAVIIDLGNQALKALMFYLNHFGMMTKDQFGRIKFELNKLKATVNPLPTKSLDGPYTPERGTYLDSGKKKAISGTAVHELHQQMHSGIFGQNVSGNDRFQLIATTDVEHLTTDDYRLLESVKSNFDIKSMSVVYFDKLTRKTFLAIPVNGLLYDIDEDPINLNFGMYAMDRYGNLFVRKPGGTGDDYFNHSSFNAGGDVVCAGMIKITNGSLVEIDSESGHYKPTRMEMWACIKSLNEQGVDLTNTTVSLMVFPANAQPQKQLYNATTFLAFPMSHPRQII